MLLTQRGESPNVRPSGALPRRFLVVDDNACDRRSITDTLVEAGAARANISSADSLVTARHVVSTTEIDCILLDLSLPDAVGAEGVGVLAAAAPEVPIVVVSGRRADALVYAAMAEGADEYLWKGDLDPARLHDLLTRAEQRRRGSHRSARVVRVVRDEASIVLDAIDAPTAALDGQGRIVAVNRAWAATALAAGATPASTGIGVNYLTASDHAVGEGSDGAAEAAAGIRAVLARTSPRFVMDYPARFGDHERWFSLRVTPLGPAGGGAVVAHLDITDLKLVERRLQRDEARLTSVLHESSPIFALIDADAVVQHVSRQTTELLGLGPTDTIGDSAFARVDPDDHAVARAAFASVLATPGARERLMVRALDAQDRWRDLDLVIVNLLSEPSVGAIAVTGNDVTDGRLNQIARRLETRLLQRLPTAVIVTDARGVVVYWNSLATTMYGYSVDEAVGRSIMDLNIGPTEPRIAEEIMTTVRSAGRWEGCYDARRADGSVIPVHTTLERVDDDEIAFHGIVGASIDVSERRRLEEDLAFQALHDPLTGLPNRRLFVDHVETTLARCSRTGRRATIMSIDVDDFKSVNDRFGHVAADTVLQWIGQLISGVLRTGDIVARLGGDEFVVCCDDLVDSTEVLLVADRISRALSVPFRSGADSVSVTASIGVAVSGPDARAETLLRNADAAMYAAKEGGKAQVELFDDELHEQVRRRIELAGELELELAIDCGQVEAHFQPLVALDTNRLIGFEALARWTHATRGPVSPSEFIQAAEETRLIGRLGRKILGDACAALASWLDASPEHPLKVAVNISALQLADPEFPDVVRRLIAAADVPPGLVCLELTESALADPELAAAALRRLKEVGVEIAIDDFGTGYSSLSRLHRFPLDHLKIDRSFVAGIPESVADVAIVTAVLNLASSLTLQTVAEGVETEEQLARLRELGCDVGQGFLWSRPVPATEALAMVSSPAWGSPHTASPDGSAEGTGSTEQRDRCVAPDPTMAVAVLAHELVNPITALAGLAEILANTTDPALRARSIAGVHRAAGMAHAALDLARDVAALDAGTLTITRAPARLADVVDEVTALVGHLVGDRLRVAVPDVVVDGDRKRLAAVLSNLLSNAAKHAPEGTPIDVVGTVGGTTLTLTVVDRGPGVPVDKLGVIFRKFGRASRSSSGTGLGLYVAREVARAHGGELGYRDAKGGGAEFTLQLPLVVTADDPAVGCAAGDHVVHFYSTDDELVEQTSAAFVRTLAAAWLRSRRLRTEQPSPTASGSTGSTWVRAGSDSSTRRRRWNASRSTAIPTPNACTRSSPRCSRSSAPDRSE